MMYHLTVFVSNSRASCKLSRFQLSLLSQILTIFPLAYLKFESMNQSLLLRMWMSSEEEQLATYWICRNILGAGASPVCFIYCVENEPAIVAHLHEIFHLDYLF